VEALEDSLERLTQGPYRQLLTRIRARLGVFQLHAWDLVYGQALLDETGDTSLKGGDAGVRLGSFVAGMGQNPDVLPIRLVFQAGPQFRTRCVPVDPPRDIRLVSNPSNSLGGYTSLFHEYGVALLEANLPDSRPSMRAVPDVWREAMGDLLGNFSVESDWLGGGLNLPDSLVTRYRTGWLHARLLSLRTLLLLSRFERTLYLSPQVNPDTLWRGLSERYLEVEATDPPVWASETAFLVHPMGFTRYLVSQAISSQILRTVRTGCGRAEGGCLGDFMRDRIWKPGATQAWEKVLEEATGAPLGARSLARELGAP
jgi:peptidyl-dipeptidase A